MKALTLTQLHTPLTYGEVKTPVPEKDQALVKLHAAALNHRDVWITKGLYPGIRLGAIPGSDGAGEVDGKPVIINPNLGWGTDERFQDKKYHILGMPTDGTFAEYTVVNKDRLHPKPGHLSWEEAAALPLAGLTAYRAVFSRGNLKAGERVLITGIGGGVALMAFQFARAAGANVYVTSSSDEKIDRALDLGALGGANYTAEGWAEVTTKAAGDFDLIIDSAGGKGFKQLVDLAGRAGRIVLYGGSTGKIQINPQKVFWKQLNILGTTMGSDKDFEDMVNFVSHKGIKPIIDNIYTLGNGNDALQRMADGKQLGKIVLTLD